MQHHLVAQRKYKTNTTPAAPKREATLPESNEEWLACICAVCEGPASICCCCCRTRFDVCWEQVVHTQAWLLVCCPCIFCTRLLCPPSSTMEIITSPEHNDSPKTMQMGRG